MADNKLSRHYLDRVIEGIWLAIVFLVPLLFNPQCMTAYYFVKTMALVMLVSVLLGCVIARYILYPAGWRWSGWRSWIRRSPLQAAAIILGLSWIVSMAFSIIPHKSIMGNLAGALGLVPELCWITFFIIVAGEIHKREQIIRAIYALLLSTAVVCIIGIVQFIHPAILPWFSYEGRVFSTDGNPLSLSGLLAVTMPLTLAMIILSWDEAKKAARGHVVPLLLLALFILQMTCTALAQYSITILLFVIGIFIFFTLIGFYLKRKTTFVLGILSLLMLAVIAVYLVFPILFTPNPVVLSDNPAESPIVAEQVGLPTLSIRVHAWRSAADIIIESPQIPYYDDSVHGLRRLIGYGPETFIAVSQQTFPDALKSLYTYRSLVISQPENQFLLLAATTGIAGLVAFLCLLAVFFYITLRLLLRTRSRMTGILAAAFIAAGVQYCAHISFNPAVISPAMTFWLTAALAVACIKLDGRDDESDEAAISLGDSLSLGRKIAAPCVIVAFLLIGAWLTLPPYLANIRAQEGLKMWEAEPARAMQKLEEAVWLQPEESYYYNLMGNLAFSMAMQSKAGVERDNLLDMGENSLKDAIRHEPQMSIWRYRLADMQVFRAIQGDKGKMDSALTYYEQAARLFPDNAVILNKWSMALIIAGKFEDAEKMLQQSISADCKWVQTRFYLALLQQHIGQEVEAGRQFAGSIDNKVENIGYFINFCARARASGQIENIYIALHKYLNVNAGDWTGWVLSGITNLYCQRYTEAVTDFEQAAQYVPDQQALKLAGIAEGLLKSNPDDPGAGHRIAEKLMQRIGQAK